MSTKETVSLDEHMRRLAMGNQKPRLSMNSKKTLELIHSLLERNLTLVKRLEEEEDNFDTKLRHKDYELRQKQMIIDSLKAKVKTIHRTISQRDKVTAKIKEAYEALQKAYNILVTERDHLREQVDILQMIDRRHRECDDPFID